MNSASTPHANSYFFQLKKYEFIEVKNGLKNGFQFGLHLDSIWTPFGLRPESIWTPFGLRCFCCIWIGVQMESKWSPVGVQMESKWSPNGVQMDSGLDSGTVFYLRQKRFLSQTETFFISENDFLSQKMFFISKDVFYLKDVFLS